MLYRKNYIPLDYVSFLNYASDRIFLQKVGGGYIFVHRRLAGTFCLHGVSLGRVSAIAAFVATILKVRLWYLPRTSNCVIV
ncbi:hypothetical protein I8751_27210 [Nostocaceae cyanobacterium CENA357]|uniref:Uncharacterized protein n=1 Tax=Atlanticothrix silvestris CENA357 TaxID=1725252 RepID=A0A8J7HN78_9CYAN|nr:hypothetical protein [Atlanticothrix silvestris]MBH8555963.1 hypothetical protein [Atlanticothrix silvestris CENA357]